MLNKILESVKLYLKIHSNQIEKLLNKIMSIDGQISRNEAKNLIKLAKNISSDNVIVEIGSYQGRSTLALAFGSLLGNHNRIYAIDPHIEFFGMLGGQFDPKDQAKLYYNLVKYKVGEIVAVVSLSSLNAAKSWSLRNIGLLFIDGDHTYDAVRSDYESWAPFLIEKGIIAFHDSTIAEVKKIIYELLEEKKIIHIGEIDSLSWFQVK